MGRLGDGQRRVDGLLHEQKRLLHQRIVGRQVERDAGLRLLRPQRIVDNHDVEALASLCASDMPVDQPSREMRRACTARAGQAIAVDDKNLVGNGSQPIELFQEIRMVEPAHAAAIAVQQPGTVKDEGAGADANEWHARSGRALKVASIFRTQVRNLIDQAADDDEIVEQGGIAQPFLWMDCNTGAGHDWLHRCRQDAPAA